MMVCIQIELFAQISFDYHFQLLNLQNWTVSLQGVEYWCFICEINYQDFIFIQLIHQWSTSKTHKRIIFLFISSLYGKGERRESIRLARLSTSSLVGPPPFSSPSSTPSGWSQVWRFWTSINCERAPKGSILMISKLSKYTQSHTCKHYTLSISKRSQELPSYKMLARNTILQKHVSKQ